jgi:hypothetical protein
MKCKRLFGLLLLALATLYPASAQAAFIYQFVGIPAAPVAPGTEIGVEVWLAEVDTNVVGETGIYSAAVQIAPVTGLVPFETNPIVTSPEWGFVDIDVDLGLWQGLTIPDTYVTTNPVKLATYFFTANKTTTFTAVDPLVLNPSGSVFDRNDNVYRIGSLSGTVEVVPEPATLIGWSTALAAVAGFGWMRTRRHRRVQCDA